MMQQTDPAPPVVPGEELLRLWGRACAYAGRLTRDRGLAEEIASEAITRLWARAPGEVQSEWSYVCRQVLDLAQRARTRSRRQVPLPSDDLDSLRQDLAASDSTVEGLWVEEFLAIAREEADHLPEPDRRVVIAHLFEEMTFLGKASDRHARLSSALDSTIPRTRHQLSRGLIRLRARLERRLKSAGTSDALRSSCILVPLLPRLLARQGLSPAWRRASWSRSMLLPLGAGAGLFLAAVAGVALAPRADEAGIGERAQLAQAAPAVVGAALPIAPARLAPNEAPLRSAPALVSVPGAASMRASDELVDEFHGTPTQVIVPRCDEGTVLPLGDSGWNVRNLRTESCVPSANVNLIAIQADGLRVASDINDAFGGYPAVDRELSMRPLEWVLTVNVTVAHVEDPYHRPVPQCSTQLGAAQAFDDELASPGWCATRDGERLQVLALRDADQLRPSSYILDVGIEHTVELTSLHDGSELRAWPSAMGQRPELPLVEGASLGELRRILFSGPNWKTFDYRVQRVAVRRLGAEAYGESAPNSSGDRARLSVWRAGPAGSGPAGLGLAGSGLAGAGGLELEARGLPAQAVGRVLVGGTCAAPFSGLKGSLVGGPRRGLAAAQADADGRARLHLSELEVQAMSALGSELHFQLLYRDPGQRGQPNATQGVRLTPLR